MTLVLAMLGAKALYLTYAWLASAIAASWLSNRKGYGEKPGLASGLLLPVVGILVWLVWPARETSVWKRRGMFGRRPDKVSATARAEEADDTSDAPPPERPEASG